MGAKDYVTLGISIFAVVLSLANFRYSLRMGRRQLFLSSNRPLVDWAGKVTSLMGDVTGILTVPSADERRTKLFIAASKAGALIAEGMIVVSYCTGNASLSMRDDNDLLSTVADIGNALSKDASAQSSDKRFELQIYGTLIERFSNQVVEQMRTVVL